MQATSEGHWPIPESIVEQLPGPPISESCHPKGAKVPFAGRHFAIDWLRRVVDVHQRDKVAERKKKILKLWIFMGVALAFGATCVAVVLPVAFAVGLIGAVTAVVSALRHRKYNAADVEDYRLEAFSGLILALAPELNPKRPIDANLDFRAFTACANPPHAGEGYCQRWLSVQLPLRDGSYASLSVTIAVKQKSRSKRKYTKLKQRRIESVTVRLSPPAGGAFNARSAAPASCGRTVLGMKLARVTIQPQAASFYWTAPVTRVERGRSGWSSPTGVRQVESKQLVAALMASYQLAASGERHAA
jgi:hypothetical protein